MARLAVKKAEEARKSARNSELKVAKQKVQSTVKIRVDRLRIRYESLMLTPLCQRWEKRRPKLKR